jgi:hypothetical protein
MATAVREHLSLADAPLVGSVVAVDTRRTTISVRDQGVPAGVSDLLALDAADGWVVALVEAADAGSLVAMPIGTLPRDGRFRRGAADHPRVGAGARLIEGARLRALMEGLADEVETGERLVLGRYAGSAVQAVADGNSLFQRHLALLGSTGVGKSWAVASIVERAARLRHANITSRRCCGATTSRRFRSRPATSSSRGSTRPA